MLLVNSKLRMGLLLMLAVAGCSTLLAVRFCDRNHPAVMPGQRFTGEKIYNKHLIDSAVTLLRSGYVVLRTGLGADSYMFARMNQKDKTYSHCGIVVVEHGYPFVYHSIGGEDNPDERLRRDSASHFFSQAHNSGFGIVRYNFTDADIHKLKHVVYAYYKARPKFDMQFDLSTDDKLYCAEFVYKALNKAMNDTGFIKTTSVLGFTFVGTDNLFVNPHAHMIWQVKFK